MESTLPKMDHRSGALGSQYDPEFGREICARLRDGQTIRQIVADPDMPSYATVFRWRKMHPEFAAALAGAPKAKAALDSFPAGAQRDYLEWISEAKQDATRQKRIATAIEWLSEGKRRHWKYQNC